MNVGDLQQKLSRWAAQDREHRFFDLYHLLYDRDWLRLAHDHVAQNAGSVTAGCDGITMHDFDELREENLQRLAEELRAQTYAPSPVRRVYIPKANGKTRPLGIAAIRDRIVQEAVRMLLEPIYEADFSQYSFGFRPTRRTMDAMRAILWSATEHKKFFWIIEGDIASYFDTIHHWKLLMLLKRRLKDGKLLRLIWRFLRAGVMEGKLFRDTLSGAPQGGIASPLLANVYLHELDRYMERYTALSKTEKAYRRRRGQANVTYVRYADDFCVLMNGRKEEAEQMREELTTFLRDTLSLTLSQEKTKITHLNDGFRFLGFEVQRKPGHDGMKTKVVLRIPDAAVKSVLAKLAHCHGTDGSVQAKIYAMNSILRGWCLYYQYASGASTVFAKVDHQAFWLLAHWLAKKHGEPRMSAILRKYGRNGTLGTSTCQLIRAVRDIPSARYRERFLKPNPYTTQEPLLREDLPGETYWTGWEERMGMFDLRPAVLTRDHYQCQRCGTTVPHADAHVDHKRPVRRFKRPVDANTLANLQTLCRSCHSAKTESDRQMESPVR